jgi:phage-related protein
MAFDGTDPCWIPDIPTVSRDEEWRLRVAQFGDGYAQRTLDGINALNQKWQVTFAMRPSDIIIAMFTYLQQQKANAFTFKEPVGGGIYQVFCDQWHVDWIFRRSVSGGTKEYYGTLSAEFVKANGITA